MEKLFKDAIEGFIILAVVCGIYGLSNDVLALAGMAQKDGLSPWANCSTSYVKSCFPTITPNKTVRKLSPPG